MAERGCKTCALAEWRNFTPTGRLRYSAGRCKAEPRVTGVPSCAKVTVSRIAIWPDQGQDCPMWAPPIEGAKL